ncbi:MAG: nucleotide pyrophosphohydrolase [Candidatus Hodarchaeales archaeon]|jgi:NTP pyrophosphatase (non-canonical NTP hydrolase)
MVSNSFEELQKKVANFVSERSWEQFHNPKNLAMSIAIESSEIMELFQWKTTDESIDDLNNNQKLKQELAFELADVLIYCLSLSYRTDIDLEKAILEKLEINGSRFPVKKVYGILPPEQE